MKKVELKNTTIYGEVVRTSGSQVYLKQLSGEIAKFHQDQIEEASTFDIVMLQLKDFDTDGYPSVEEDEAIVTFKGFTYNVMMVINLDGTSKHTLETIHNNRASQSDDINDSAANFKKYASIKSLVKNARKFLEK